MAGVFDMDNMEYLARISYEACISSYEAQRENFERYMESLSEKREKALNGAEKEVKQA